MVDHYIQELQGMDPPIELTPPMASDTTSDGTSADDRSCDAESVSARSVNQTVSANQNIMFNTGTLNLHGQTNQLLAAIASSQPAPPATANATRESMGISFLIIICS